MANTALILEGGGLRGIYTAGVIDVMLEGGFADSFASVWGVSAGATNAATFKAKQVGRTCRDFLAFRDDPRFMSFQSYLRTGNIAGADFIYHDIMDNRDPFDYDTFNANPLRMVAVATDVTFGTAEYLEIASLPEDTDKVRASASLPGVSQIVEIGERRFLDGGTCDSVPVEVALGEVEGAGVPEDLEPAERAVIVLTRNREYEKGPVNAVLRRAYQQRYAGYPYYLDAIFTRHERYNAQRQHIWELEEAGKVFVIAPEEPPALSVTESDGGKLLDLYVRGRLEAAAQLDALRSFLA